MKIAVPVANGLLCMHFGHAPEFVVVTVDDTTRIITSSETLVAPEHEPGLLPKWLGEKGVNAIIAGGMGSRAQALFSERGITVYRTDRDGTVTLLLDGTSVSVIK